MPNAKDLQIFSTASPNAFVSPFSDKPPLSFYSSLAILRTKSATSCVPCALTDLRQQSLDEFLMEISVPSVQVNLGAGIEPTKTVPELPLYPRPVQDTLYGFFDLGLYFPQLSGPEFYGAKTFGPFAEDVWLVSHEEAPVFVDDDFLLNGTYVDRTNSSHSLFGGATTVLAKILAGVSFTVDIHSVAGLIYASGQLRFYNADPTL